MDKVKIPTIITLHLVKQRAHTLNVYSTGREREMVLKNTRWYTIEDFRYIRYK